MTARPALAQDHEHSSAPPATQDGHQGHAGPGLFPTYDASGTSWVPDVTPMYGRHVAAGRWELMLHGNAFVQYLNEYAPIHRGSHQLGSINWVMAMARRPLASGRFGLRTMLSLEPWTIPGCGYPDLLATGELCDGDGLHDRQHPHDLFMELAAEYERPVPGGLTWHLYGGPSAEPALGPPAFPHRASAMPNPVAPISHHWLDATHIAFGAVTTGVSSARWRAEASAFNGRDPDEARTNVEFGALDSFSGRLTVRPRASLALQISVGRLEAAEQDFAGGTRYDLTRTTASVMYHSHPRSRARLAATLAWGTNAERGQQTHAGLAEAALSIAERDVVFGRLELNGKPSHALHVHEQPDAVLTVAKVQAGYTRYLAVRGGLQPGLGGSVSAAIVPPSIRPHYGGVGFGIGVFALVRPALH